MSSSNLTRRAALSVLALAASAVLAGCTMTPVYNDNSAASALQLNFAAPTNPLEQIVYQDLTTKFGAASTPDAPQVSVTVTSYARAISQASTTDPAKGNLMTVSGVLRITRGGQPVLTTSRQATATYSSDSQVLADNSALTGAQEQAAHALADTLELTIISALAPQTANRQ
jgi:LPS-assembly lipoprotein